MDSVSQLVLGAAVGEMTLGKKVGNKAALWGAVCGTIPDLDVLLKPFLSEVEYLGYHRAFSHSITFAIMFAPILAYWISTIFHKDSGANWRDWTKLCFFAIITHPILDSFTVYGTQLFQPFTNYPVAFNSIFIIDPIYTIPMLLSFLIILFLKRESNIRFWINRIALGFSTTYLLFTIFNKLHVNSEFKESFLSQYNSYENYFTAPLAANNLYWMSLFEKNDTLYVGTYSIFDEDNQIEFNKIPKNSHLLEDQKDTFVYQKMMWFSQGYYAAKKDSNDVLFSDLRFSRTDQFINLEGKYIFTFRLKTDDQGNFAFVERFSFNNSNKNDGMIKRIQNMMDNNKGSDNFWPRLWRRSLGDKTAIESNP